ncbi:alpha/beta hydrolase [Rhodococcoides yunnanense]|uniref:Alpha/beta hydrolase n=1 Tax=Rhodococcoides yunnanense TaxID=278209 RepID=A0ABU4BL22_9NOCA|nr:alpha/beta hydrolase [Rhodococcus yunnanensis]MDV6264919.1 alpha/beta hydrolase [Rhodococcus yunnanensis]
MSIFHPELAFGRFIPKLSLGPRSTRIIRRLPLPRSRANTEDLFIEDIRIQGSSDGPTVLVRIYKPKHVTGAAPALLWIHGGGMVIGDHLMDEASNIAFARTLGITVASVDYRLAPQHVGPAAVEDAYSALTWLFDHAEERGIDPTRIAIGGASAGGGIAAGLALMALDRGQVRPAFQLLVYPMLDDRTVVRTDVDTRHVRIWVPGSNRFGWTAYLGQAPGGEGVSVYAVPARREDLSGLPPAWIGVGSLDLFFDEDRRYGERLEQCGVPCRVDVVPGAFHGFDALFPTKTVSRAFWRAQADALREALA